MCETMCCKDRLLLCFDIPTASYLTSNIGNCFYFKDNTGFSRSLTVAAIIWQQDLPPPLPQATAGLFRFLTARLNGCAYSCCLYVGSTFARMSAHAKKGT